MRISDWSSDVCSSDLDAVKEYSETFGWEPFLYPRGPMLLFNIPNSDSESEQFVFNAITRAPARFTGLNALCWALFNDAPYFGGADGTVYKFDTGASVNGTNIELDGIGRAMGREQGGSTG